MIKAPYNPRQMPGCSLVSPYLAYLYRQAQLCDLCPRVIHAPEDSRPSVLLDLRRVRVIAALGSSVGSGCALVLDLLVFGIECPKALRVGRPLDEKGVVKDQRNGVAAVVEEEDDIVGGVLHKGGEGGGSRTRRLR